MSHNQQHSDNLSGSFENILGPLYDVELQIAEVKTQIQGLERDLNLTLSALEKTKSALSGIGEAMERTRLDAERQLEAITSSHAAEDEMREAVTSSFSEMFQVISKVFGTAQKLGIVTPGHLPATSEPASLAASPVEQETAAKPESQTVPEAEQPIGEPVEESSTTAISEETEEIIETQPEERFPTEWVEEPAVDDLDTATETIEELPSEEAQTIEETVTESAPSFGMPTELPDISDLPGLEELAKLAAGGAETSEETEPEVPLPTLPELPEDLAAIPEAPEETEDDEEGDPDAVADLIESLSTPISTEMPEIASETDSAAADLEKLLDQQED